MLRKRMMGKLLAIGTDAVEIGRILLAHKRHGNRFLGKIFLENEILYSIGRHSFYASLAARFAAKEATAKALGSGISNGITFRSISVSMDSMGKPMVKLHGQATEMFQAMGGQQIFLSLTHTSTLAIAYVTMTT